MSLVMVFLIPVLFGICGWRKRMAVVYAWWLFVFANAQLDFISAAIFRAYHGFEAAEPFSRETPGTGPALLLGPVFGLLFYPVGRSIRLAWFAFKRASERRYPVRTPATAQLAVFVLVFVAPVLAVWRLSGTSASWDEEWHPSEHVLQRRAAELLEARFRRDGEFPVDSGGLNQAVSDVGATYRLEHNFYHRQSSDSYVWGVWSSRRRMFGSPGRVEIRELSEWEAARYGWERPR
jgi:hypothetical protein